MLLCFFFSVVGLVSLELFKPQKLFFFIFCCAAGLGNPLLKNELCEAAG